MAETSRAATYAQTVAGVRATMAAYAQALDDGRTDEVVATFCADGSLEMQGTGTYAGHAALREAFSNWKPRQPQRHLVLNTLVTDWNDDEAFASSDVIFILKGEEGWAIQLVGRYHDVLHRADGRWRFHRRTAEFVTS